MRDFIQITRDEILPHLLNGEEVYSFTIKVYTNGNSNLTGKRLINEKLDSIAKCANDPNTVFFVKRGTEK